MWFVVVVVVVVVVAVVVAVVVVVVVVVFGCKLQVGGILSNAAKYRPQTVKPLQLQK